MINAWWLSIPIATTVIAVALLVYSMLQKRAGLATLAELVPKDVRFQLILGTLLLSAIPLLQENNFLYSIIGIGLLLCIAGGTWPLTVGSFRLQSIDNKKLLLLVVGRCVREMGVYFNEGEPEKVVEYVTKEDCNQLLGKLGLQPRAKDHFFNLERLRRRSATEIAEDFGWPPEVVKEIMERGH